MKVCLACSAGGHLSEMLNLEPFYSRHGHFFLTFRRADSESLAKRERVLFVARPARNPLLLALNFFQSLSVLLRERPDMVISTGADVALSACLIAKLFGKKIIYIESFCRPYAPSVSGRLVYPIADLFIVQWKQMLEHYPKAKFGGWIF